MCTRIVPFDMSECGLLPFRLRDMRLAFVDRAGACNFCDCSNANDFVHRFNSSR
jgi:hypothetical protein